MGDIDDVPNVVDKAWIRHVIDNDRVDVSKLKRPHGHAIKIRIEKQQAPWAPWASPHKHRQFIGLHKYQHCLF